MFHSFRPGVIVYDSNPELFPFIALGCVLQHCDLGLFKIGTGNNMTTPGVLYGLMPDYRLLDAPSSDSFS